MQDRGEMQDPVRLDSLFRWWLGGFAHFLALAGTLFFPTAGLFLVCV